MKPWRRLIPFALRVELRRLGRWPGWLLETPRIARRRLSDAGELPVALARGSSPLRRFGAAADALQRGKERNVALAAGRLDGLVVAPGQLFSYHRLVGRPSRLRGFRRGLELHDGQASAGVGGGCCQVSNLVYQLALEGGMKIVERHRHGLDLFPDHRRSVPFGCGATVFYNYRDLRFENPLDQPVLLRLWIEEGQLCGELRCARPLPWRVQVYETGHRFFGQAGRWMRENRIRRRMVLADGTLLLDEEVAHNLARVCYEPPAAVTVSSTLERAA